MNVVEQAIAFRCDAAQLIGVVSVPDQPGPRGMLIVTGGPQYRVGSHRQFALLARDLAAKGVPVLRFDYRGMGDSEGSTRSYDSIDADIASAIEAFLAHSPSVRELAIWGLCDGASAAIFYAQHDQRVRALVLCNPWARTDQSAARATLKHYYLQRLLAPDFWRKLLRGAVRPTGTMRELLGQVRRLRPDADGTGATKASLPQQLFDGLSGFNGRVFVILSGNDLIARQFADLINSSAAWRKLAGAFNISHLAEANHTFAREQWRAEVSRLTAGWINAW